MQLVSFFCKIMYLYTKNMSVFKNISGTKNVRYLSGDLILW